MVRSMAFDPPHPVAPGPGPTGIGRQALRHRVETISAPWVAAGHTGNTDPEPCPRSMRPDRIGGVFRTRRQITAAATQNQRKAKLIGADQSQHQPGNEVDGPVFAGPRRTIDPILAFQLAQTKASGATAALECSPVISAPFAANAFPTASTVASKASMVEACRALKSRTG